MEDPSKQEIVKTIGKFTDLVTEPVKQRISHPLIGSFVISWVFINWRPILYLLFAREDIKERINFINRMFYETRLEDLLYYFILPLFFAFFYTLGLKWIDNCVDYLNLKPNKNKNKYQSELKINAISNEILIVNKQVELENAKAENRPIKVLNEKILALSSEIETQKALSESRVNDIAQLTAELNAANEDRFQLSSNEHKLKALGTEYENLFFFLFDNLSPLLDEKQYKELIDRILENKIPNDLKKHIEQVKVNVIIQKSIGKNGPYTYRHVLINSLTVDDYKGLEADLKQINPNINMEVRRDYRGNSTVNTLDITYPDESMYDQIHTIVNSYEPKRFSEE